MRSVLASLLLMIAAGPSLAAPADDRVADGLRALAARDMVKAMESFTQALEADPGHVMAAYERGRLLLVIGEPQNAIADFTAAVLGDPAFGRAYVGRAQAKLALNDGKSAIADLNRAVEVAPRDADVHMSRAAFRLRIGNIPGARADLENARAVADEATARKIGEMLDRLK